MALVSYCSLLSNTYKHKNFLIAEVVIGPGSVVAKDAVLKGDITIGGGNVIRSKVQILAEGGPITIGNSNVFEEEVVILNAVGEKSAVMMIGNSNAFKVGAHIESLRIGDSNVFNSNCYVGRHAEVTSACVVESNCQVTCTGVIPIGTVMTVNDEYKLKNLHHKLSNWNSLQKFFQIIIIYPKPT